MKSKTLYFIGFLLLYSVLSACVPVERKQRIIKVEKKQLILIDIGESEQIELDEKICVDCFAQLDIEGFNDKFRVVQGDDNHFYLNHDIYQMSNVYGAVFLDYRNSLTDKVLYVYAHHMSDGTMFSPLLKYEDEAYLNEYPSLSFLDEEWLILKGVKVDEVKDDLFASGFNQFINEEHYQKYIRYLDELFQTTLLIDEVDQLLILSTCFEIGSQDRFIVIAKKVERGK